jgi:addiction module HigA family antidote
MKDRDNNLSGLAKHIGVLPKTINEICRGKRGISAEMAMKLSKALGGSPQGILGTSINSIIPLIST